ncbi:MAG: NADH-dependent [FeFe] hydrogenase, group A6, partial [Proteobacteria bacterium]|nr:NADH-dependent [FeFe] hydrogenase, group A6 [Pseudomonadota bacterium]
METKMIKLTINNMPVEVPEGTVLLDAAKKLKFNIPTLCNHPDLHVAGNCRVCVVELKGSKTLVAACAMPVAEGMEVLTSSIKVRKARKDIIELLLSEHVMNCTKCYKSGDCELQTLSKEYLVELDRFADVSIKKPVDKSSPSIQKDESKCVKCQRCVRTCAELQHVSALTMAHKGEHTTVETFLDLPMDDVVCTNCGQCINRCPTGAMGERNYIEEVWEVLSDPNKHVVVQTAPAVRVALGELLGFSYGTSVTGKMVTALRRMGFNSVFDTNFTADLTIMEEGHELLDRLQRALVKKEKVSLPVITSCSPGWIKYIEHEFPNLLNNLSTCKSPQQMFGAVAKTYFAQKADINPANMVVVSVMPCTAKKFEAARPEMNSSGYRDVDYVLTTRELGLMIQQAGIDFAALEESECDSILGKYTGAAVIFGATGGVMEAAIRTAYTVITGRDVPFKNLEILPVRGMEGIKEATLKLEKCLPEWKFLEGVEFKAAVAHGLANARKLMQKIEKGEAGYHFVEIMACPGGCLGGGGQPIPTNDNIRKKRAEAIYAEDRGMPLRKSMDNPEVKMIYDEFLKKPLGHKSHEL